MVETTRYIGIDPGKSGAFAVLTDTGDAEVKDMPLLPGGKGYDEQSIVSYLRGFARPGEGAEHASATRVLACIEVPFAMPRQSSTTTAVQFDGYGMLRGMIRMAGIPLVIVTPKVWQKSVYGGRPRGSDPKEMALMVASQLFPYVELHGPKGGFKDGRADALLIAEYCRRLHRGAP